MYGNLDYILKSSTKPMMSFILENKSKNKRKDINDKETHIHGIREVFDEEIDFKVRLALKTSVCNGKKEYNQPEYIPPTTLPDNPDNPDINACAANPETCMTTKKFSNAEKRIELYENVEAQASSGKRMLNAARNSNADSVTTAYNNMRDFLIEGKLDAATDDTLLKSLLLAGFKKDELPTVDLKDWVNINANEIKNKAQTVWDMYGTEREVSIDNAKLNVVNIDAKQDSFVRFNFFNFLSCSPMKHSKINIYEALACTIAFRFL